MYMYAKPHLQVGMIATCIVVFLYHAFIIEGKLLGAFILPHGGIALDPNHFHTDSQTAKLEAWALNKASNTVGETVRGLQPDLIILSTPHGIADSTKFMFYLNEIGSGIADTDNCGCPPCCYNISVRLDYNTTSIMLKYLLSLGISVSGLTAYGPPGNDQEPFPLRWGEVIPLHFLNLPAITRTVILSIPSRRYIADVPMIPELLVLGDAMWKMIEQMTEKVVVVISGDLCHRFDPNGPYGYSNASEPFDEAIGQWVAEQNDIYLLDVAANLVDKCYSCGYTGFVLLEGVLKASRKSGVFWNSSVIANYHPSYYGMMIAQFIPHSLSDNKEL